jgi:ABC-type enterochelin transport system ATPase subunit
MISNLRLKFGHSSGAVAESINTTPITVFVGPNNSGKSKVLSEIEQYCRSGQKNATFVILDDLAFSGLSGKKVDDAIEQIKQPPNPGEALNINNIIVGSRYGRFQVPFDELRLFIGAPTSNTQAFCLWFLTHCTLMLNDKPYQSGEPTTGRRPSISATKQLSGPVQK